MGANDKYSAIDAYLREHFKGFEVEQKHDFDRGAQTFKVHRACQTSLVKFGDEFIEDNSVAEILRLLNSWALAEVLVKEVDLGVMVTRRGLETFDRG